MRAPCGTGASSINHKSLTTWRWHLRTKAMTLRGRAAAQAAARVRADRTAIVSSPGIPSGHGNVEPGSLAKNQAVAATPALKVPATAIIATASHGAATSSGTAAVPSRVTGATIGAAATLASSA